MGVCMSRKGNYYDNAYFEFFYGILNVKEFKIRDEIVI